MNCCFRGCVFIYWMIREERVTFTVHSCQGQKRDEKTEG